MNRDGDRLNAHHPGENPQLIAMGNRVFATWTALGPNERRGGTLAIALSDDGGATWRPGAVPFGGQKGAQTFPKMVASGSIAHMVWLDSRGGSQGLRYARSLDGGSSWADDRPLAPRTCDCCWNSVAAAPDGSVSALYRGHDPRDMMHIGSRDGKAWRNTGSVGGFDWRVQACPHVGGALVRDGAMLHALVWTGREGAWGLFHATSRDAGNSWSAPRRLGTEDARNADLARSPDGTLVAIWDEPGTGETAIRIARSSDAGVSWQQAERLPAARNATNPRVTATSRGTTTVWLEGAPYAGAVLKVNGAPLATP